MVVRKPRAEVSVDEAALIKTLLIERSQSLPQGTSKTAEKLVDKMTRLAVKNREYETFLDKVDKEQQAQDQDTQ